MIGAELIDHMKFQRNEHSAFGRGGTEKERLAALRRFWIVFCWYSDYDNFGSEIHTKLQEWEDGSET